MALPTTYRSFVDNLEALTITGVVRQYTQGPPTAAPATADCPCQFVIYPGGEERSLVFGSQGGLRSIHAELWVVVEPIAQNVQAENWDDGVDFMDAVGAALQGADCFTKAHLEWDSSLVEREIAGTRYWVVVTNIRGTG